MIDVFVSGVMNGMKVVVVVGIMLIVFVSVIVMVNIGFENLGDLVGFSGIIL